MSSIKHTEIFPTDLDPAQILLQKTLTANGAAIGAGGSQRIVGAGDTTAGKVVFCIVPSQDTVWGAATGNAVGQVGPTQYAGIPIYGIFTSITQSSGDATYYFLP